MKPDNALQLNILLTVPRLVIMSFVCHAFARLFIAALWSPSQKGLTLWLSFVMDV